MANKDKIVTYHIGGRHGSIGIPRIRNFEDEVLHYIFDADESCVEQIKTKWNNAIVLPYCIGDKNANVEFFINYDPYTSSALKFNENYSNYCSELSGKLFGPPYNTETFDYVFGPANRLQKTVKLKTFTLDFLRNRGEISPADFLSIDSQGYELNILLGARQLLQESIVAVKCEVNFCDLYEGCGQFSEINEYLTQCNFLLAGLTTFDVGYRRIASHMRGKGIPLQGEALYFIDPEFISSSDQRILDDTYNKLSFISLAHGYIDFAYDIMLRKSANVVDNRQKYTSFLSEFESMITREKHLPQVWSDVFSFEESNRRFSLEAATRRKDLKKRRNLKNLFHIRSLKSGLKMRVLGLVRRILKSLNIKIELDISPSEFEKFLSANGFNKAVSEIRNKQLMIRGKR